MNRGCPHHRRAPSCCAVDVSITYTAERVIQRRSAKNSVSKCRSRGRMITKNIALLIVLQASNSRAKEFQSTRPSQSRRQPKLTSDTCQCDLPLASITVVLQPANPVLSRSPRSTGTHSCPIEADSRRLRGWGRPAGREPARDRPQVAPTPSAARSAIRFSRANHHTVLK